MVSPRPGQVHIDPVPLAPHPFPGEVSIRVEKVHVISFFHIPKCLYPFSGELFVEQPDPACISTCRLGADIIHQPASREAWQQFPQPLEVHPLPFQSEFQVLEVPPAWPIRFWISLGSRAIRRFRGSCPLYDDGVDVIRQTAEGMTPT